MIMTALRRIGDPEVAAVANHNSVRTLWYDTSCIFDNGSTCIGQLLSEFVQQRSCIILGWKRFVTQAYDFIRLWTRLSNKLTDMGRG